MRAFDDLVRAGKVLYIGFSNTPAWIVARAELLAALRGWAPVIAIQVEYNLLQRGVEREFVRMATALDLAIGAWSPLAGGALLLGGREGEKEKDGVRRVMAARAATDRTKQVAATVMVIGGAGGLELAAAALAPGYSDHRPENRCAIGGCARLPALRARRRADGAPECRQPHRGRLALRPCRR